MNDKGQKSTADKLREAAEIEQAQEANRKAEVETLQKCANRLFSSEDGLYWAKRFLEAAGVFEIEKSLDGQRMAFSAGKKTMYIAFFKKLLDKDILAKIERGE